jgi:hypothetical protein
VLHALEAEITARADRLRRAFARGAARGAALAVAALLLLAGIAFLTAAAWIWLARAESALAASLVIGAVYGLAGLVVLGLALRRPQPAPPPVAPPPPPPPPPVSLSLTEAFLIGWRTGRDLRKK